MKHIKIVSGLVIVLAIFVPVLLSAQNMLNNNNRPMSKLEQLQYQAKLHKTNTNNTAELSDKTVQFGKGQFFPHQNMFNQTQSRKNIINHSPITNSDDINTAWIQRYNGPASTEDYAYAMVTDGIGNVYVTGASDSDYVTVKYNNDGDVQWTARYDYPVNDVDVAYEIAVDASGNVYVSGYSEGDTTWGDFATIKYNGDGETLWVRRYNSPDNSSDQVQAMTIDNSGNVYVTGTSYFTGSSYDYLTIKYNTNGDTLWTRRYNGTANSDDLPCGIGVDALGNVYVTGTSAGSGTNYDYATVKYNSLGAQQWVSRYNNPNNNSDYACALTLDNSANVYITGNIHNSSSFADYLTIKYNTNGDSLWSRSYNGPDNGDDYTSALFVDGSGNVYVTGFSTSSSTSYDYATIKYNSSGETLWTRRYNGSANSYDNPYAIIVDGLGNVYVTGISFDAVTSNDYLTIKYNSSGDTLWVRSYNGPGNYEYGADAIALDGSGNVFVTGYSFGAGTNYDYTTIKYNSSGDSIWTRRYDGITNAQDECSAMVIDNLGNAYLTGMSNNEYLTIKYNTSGVMQWLANYKSPATGNNLSSAIAVDDGGNVYITGYSSGDYATIKYNSIGETLWVRRFDSPGNGNDEANAIAVDDAGNVYVTGWSFISWSDIDYTTIKYNASGVEQWVSKYNGPANALDYAVAIAIDNIGNIYVTGTSQGSTYDFLTVKYDRNTGDSIWTRRYDAGQSDEARAIAVDNSGNVTVTGLYSAGGHTGYLTVNYNSNGDTIWSRKYDGNGDMNNATALAADNSGNVYVTGYATFSSNLNYATVKYNPSGDTEWVRRYGSTSSEDCANDITVDSLGNVIVTGRSYFYGTAHDFATIMYSPDGETIWSKRYNGPANDNDYPSAVAVNNIGDVYVAGISTGIGTFADYTLIKYSPHGPHIVVYPISYNLSIQQNHTLDTILSISNSGELDLTWSISEIPAVDWLSEDLTSGLISSVSDTNIIISFNSTGLSSSVYQCTLQITTNDLENPIKNIPIQLNVVVPGWAQQESVTDVVNAVKDGGALVGAGDYLYAFIGTKTNKFRKYSIGTKSGWENSDSMIFGHKYKFGPPLVIDTIKFNKKFPGKGAAMCYDGISKIYAIKGNSTYEFFVYDMLADVGWSALSFTPAPKGMKAGASLAYLDGKVYLLAGGYKNTDPTNFYCYDPLGDTINGAPWIAKAGVNFGPSYKPWKAGSCLTELDGMIYALQGGGKGNYFYMYNSLADTLDGTPWTQIDSIPAPDTIFGKAKKKVLVKDGGAMASGGGKIYAIKGGGTDAFWQYTPLSEVGWERLDSIPVFDKKHAPKTGAAMAYADGKVWLLVGNKKPDFWNYIPEAISKIKNQKSKMNIQTENSQLITHNLQLNITPNPFSKTTTIHYNVPISSKVTIKLYNTLGKLIETLNDSYLNAGTYTKILSTTTLTKGLYFMHYQDNTNHNVVKLIVE